MSYPTSQQNETTIHEAELAYENALWLEEARTQFLTDPNLTNTERRIIEENPTIDPYELLDTFSGFELT